jgi:hypothetical protein
MTTEYANTINLPVAGSPRFERDTVMALARIRAALGPTGTPAFGSLTLPSLTADKPIYADTDKILQSITVGSSLAFSAPTLNTIQGIRTVDAPTFGGLTSNGDITLKAGQKLYFDGE